MKLLRLLTLAFLAIVFIQTPAFAQAVQDSNASGRAGALVPCVDRYGTAIKCVVTGVVAIDPTTGAISAISGGGGSSGPSTVTPTDRAGTITTGGTAQNAMAANASRKGWCIQNPPTATEVLQVRSGAAATITTGMTIPIGGQACNPPGIVDVGIVSVLGATTGHAWQGTEYQ